MHPTTTLLLSRSNPTPSLGVILGSGFSNLAHLIQPLLDLPFADLPGFPTPSVPGHPGRLLLGQIGQTNVALLVGRAHFYEGHTPEAVTLPIRVLAEWGVRHLLLTNAAGGIREDLDPGDLVSIEDHINLMGFNPLRGPGGPERFVDLSQVYSPALRERLHAAARAEDLQLKRGVYLAVSGPSYETPAEIRAFRALGADLVGMSTVPEAIVARYHHLEVAALSCVTNKAAGLGGTISHAEVIELGHRAADSLSRLIRRFATTLADP